MGSVLGFPGFDPGDAAIGRRLKHWREDRGVDVETLARALSLTPEDLSQHLPDVPLRILGYAAPAILVTREVPREEPPTHLLRILEIPALRVAHLFVEQLSELVCR